MLQVHAYVLCIQTYDTIYVFIIIKTNFKTMKLIMTSSGFDINSYLTVKFNPIWLLGGSLEFTARLSIFKCQYMRYRWNHSSDNLLNIYTFILNHVQITRRITHVNQCNEDIINICHQAIIMHLIGIKHDIPRHKIKPDVYNGITSSIIYETVFGWYITQHKHYDEVGRWACQFILAWCC